MNNKYEKQGNDFLKKTGVTMEVRFYNHAPHFTGETESRDIFKVTLKRDREKHSFTFGQSISESTGTGRNKPTAYGVLTCLTKYDPEGFEDFCGEFGYDTDSRNAENIYDAVCEEWEGVKRIFTPEEIELLAEIQ